MIEEAVSGMTEETTGAGIGLIVDPEKCTRQRVLSAERNVKFHSSPWKVGQCIAEIALQSIGSIKEFERHKIKEINQDSNRLIGV